MYLLILPQADPISMKETGQTLIKTKPWITPSLQKSISIKNKLLTKYIKMKDHEKNLELHNKYKNHRNLLSTLIKQTKHKYFNKYSEDNWKNMKNNWKGIKNIITLIIFRLMFLEPFLLMMLLLVTLVILLMPLTIMSVQLP